MLPFKSLLASPPSSALFTDTVQPGGFQNTQRPFWTRRSSGRLTAWPITHGESTNTDASSPSRARARLCNMPATASKSRFSKQLVTAKACTNAIAPTAMLPVTASRVACN
eukprot:CAMPEP_0180779096 /NCGR_PEP_ID=MMETSP1038_2-20121128/46191_1 /TAXON_ID=632150 /ORGANISM="Azadinium spinosum, Strain 3D9" /LENGTH=109 /DNA_ID=CAMNT_0022814341 /DNA_START=520 /DNA_END=846 /DNA_ORIENTATION=-